MPESTDNAMILITISYQALLRAKKPNNDDVIADCTVAILFAAYFIEANINYLIEFLGRKQEVNKFYNNNNPDRQGTFGLLKKLAWFYNSFLEPNEEDKKEKKILYQKTKSKFLGLAEILNFRDNTSHGDISPIIANVKYAETLRNHAKDIVSILFSITREKTGKKIPRVIRYSDAIGLSNIKTSSSSDIY